MKRETKELRTAAKARKAERDEARVAREEFRTAARTLEDEMDVARTKTDAVWTEWDGFRRDIVRLTGELREVWTEREGVMTELRTGYRLLTAFRPEAQAIRGCMDAVLARIREMGVARRTKMEMVQRLRAEMMDRDRRMKARGRDRGAVEGWGRFATRCATRIGTAFQAMNAAAAELDESMEVIFGGGEVQNMTHNAVFGRFEEQELLRALGSLGGIFEHEENNLRRLAHQDTFENLPTAFVVPYGEGLVVVPLTGGLGGSGGAGGLGGADGLGGAGG